MVREGIRELLKLPEVQDLSLGPFNHRLPERCDRLVEQRFGTEQ
jgi:hypothetical protein